MTYCSCQGREFPDDEFTTEGGVQWHNASPRHTTLGEPEDPETIPGLEEAEEGAGASADA